MSTRHAALQEKYTLTCKELAQVEARVGQQNEQIKVTAAARVRICGRASGFAGAGAGCGVRGAGRWLGLPVIELL